VIAIKQKIDTLSRILNIHHLLAENTDHLSLGEKQRVAILRACIKQPSILFADEPTASLDPENKKIIMKLFQELNHKGTTIIMNSHDHEIIECTNTRYLIKNGIIKKL
jgi:ABC-type lipoprotein export system ATPase subunit